MEYWDSGIFSVDTEHDWCRCAVPWPRTPSSHLVPKASTLQLWCMTGLGISPSAYMVLQPRPVCGAGTVTVLNVTGVPKWTYKMERVAVDLVDSAPMDISDDGTVVAIAV